MSLLGRLISGLLAGPSSAAAREHCRRGAELLHEGRLHDSATEFERALERDAQCAAAHSGLGIVQHRLGDGERALAHLMQAVRLQPGNRDIEVLVSQLLLSCGRAAQARAQLQALAAAHPRDADVAYYLGTALRDEGRLDEAREHFERMAQAHPDHAAGLEALAALYRDTGRIDEAIAVYAQVAALRPDLPSAASAVLFHEQYRSHDRAALFRSHREWAQRFAPTPPDARVETHDPDPERRLTIGYVSADFNRSSAAQFIEPLLAARNADALRLACYQASTRADAVTSRMRAKADLWRNIDGVDDERAAALMREDRVDILVDLNGHTRGARLGVFARRAAPVQATYLGYGATTGVAAMDYRITDRWIDPPGETEAFYVERLVRLPHSMWCFSPPARAPQPAPYAPRAQITYGSLNNVAKIRPETLALWGRILAAVPDSRLLLAGVPAGECRRRISEVMATEGVAAERLVFRARASYREFLDLHREIDIALDSFPYAGGATTCDALWMGVPVLTLSGETALARTGLSILQTVGLGEWVAYSPREYLDKAVAYAGAPELQWLRAGLRERVARSPLCDQQSFASALQSAYRAIWREHCASLVH